MTRRFDRFGDGRKWHVQSLGALAHLDYNQAGAHAYEQVFLTMRQLGLPMAAAEEQFRCCSTSWRATRMTTSRTSRF